MCGRFSFAPMVKIIEERFDVRVNTLKYKPSFNCAPSQKLAVITNTHSKELSFFKWGLVPSWAKDPSIGNKFINARAESIDSKPSFKNSFKRKRCLVLSDGFFEWKKINSKKTQPYFIYLKNHELFAMAGIWDVWRDATGKNLESFAIVTTSPNQVMQSIHHRMPVILKPFVERDWLFSTDTSLLKSIMTPYEENQMMTIPVSDKVNSPMNNGPDCIEEVQENLLF